MGIVFESTLQFEVPHGAIVNKRLPDSRSFVEALQVCRDDAKAFHGGVVHLVRDPKCTTRSEHTYKVIVNGKVDETEWYVIRKVEL